MLFLDLNMPRKTGFECLTAIKKNEQLKQLNVIIYSTSSNEDMIDLRYKQWGTILYSQATGFTDLKSILQKAILWSRQTICIQSSKEKFVVQP
jgi:CheY-like chemotaxis protein